MRPLFLLALLGTSTAFAGETLFAEVTRRTECHAQKNDPRVVECTYSAGSDTVVTIVGIGQPDSSAIFSKANSAGGTYAKYQLAVGCVLINRIPATFAGLEGSYAFISPKTGKVYPDVEACRSANRK